MSFFEYYYNSILKHEFLTKYFYKNIYQLPKIEKVVLSFTLPQTSFKNILPLISALLLLSAQKPALITSKRVYVQLRVRSGLPVGCRVDIRGARKFFFVEKFVFSILPRLKEFSVSLKKNVVSFSVFNLFVFKEIEKDYESFPNLPKLNIHFVIKAQSPKEIFDFFNVIRFPIQRIKRG